MVLVFGKTWYSFFNKYDARLRVRTLSKSGSAKVRYLTTCDFPVRWHLILSSPFSDSQFDEIRFCVGAPLFLQKFGWKFGSRHDRRAAARRGGSSFKQNARRSRAMEEKFLKKMKKKVRPNIPRKSETAVFAPEAVFAGAETMRDRFSSL